MKSFFRLSGEDLVSEQEDEVEKGGAGLPRSSNAPRDVSVTSPGSVPQPGWTAPPVLPPQPAVLPGPRPTARPAAADRLSSTSAPHDPQPAILLKDCELWDFSDLNT